MCCERFHTLYFKPWAHTLMCTYIRGGQTFWCVSQSNFQGTKEAGQRISTPPYNNYNFKCIFISYLNENKRVWMLCCLFVCFYWGGDSLGGLLFAFFFSEGNHVKVFIALLKRSDFLFRFSYFQKLPEILGPWKPFCCRPCCNLHLLKCLARNQILSKRFFFWFSETPCFKSKNHKTYLFSVHKVNWCELRPEGQDLLNSSADTELCNGCKLYLYDLFPSVKWLMG